MTGKSRFFTLLIISVSLVLPCSGGVAQAKSAYSDSKFSPALQGQLSKAVRGFKSKKYAQATTQVQEVTAGAADTSDCLYIVGSLDAYGAPAMKAKRAALEKALDLAKTADDLLNVAIKARKCECFDISKSAMDGVVGACNDFEQLIDAAHKAHEASVTEVAQVALQKAYTLANNIPDVLTFAREASSIGFEDLTRTALKDLLEDQSNTADLIALMPKVTVYNMVDITRLGLKRGLEKCKTVDDYLLVYNAAKRYEMADIEKLAAYRGRKLTLINKINDEKAAPQKLIDSVQAEKDKKTKEDMMRATGQTPSGF